MHMLFTEHIFFTSYFTEFDNINNILPPKDIYLLKKIEQKFIKMKTGVDLSSLWALFVIGHAFFVSVV